VALLNRFALGLETDLRLVSDFFLFDQAMATVCTFCLLTLLPWKCNFPELTEVTTLCSKLRHLEVQKWKQIQYFNVTQIRVGREGGEVWMEYRKVER